MEDALETLDYDAFNKALTHALTSADPIEGPTDIQPTQLLVAEYAEAIQIILGEEVRFVNRLEDLRDLTKDQVYWPEPIQTKPVEIRQKYSPQEVEQKKQPQQKIPVTNNDWDEFILDNLLYVPIWELVDHLGERLPKDSLGQTIESWVIDRQIHRMLQRRILMKMEDGTILEVLSFPPQEGESSVA